MIAPTQHTEAATIAFCELASSIETPELWLRQLRSDAMARFRKVGVPTIKHENWRFTRLDLLRDHTFHLASAEHENHGTVNGIRREQLQRFDLNQKHMPTLVFIDGCWSPACSDKLPVRTTTLREALEPEHPLASDVEAALGGFSFEGPFADLNTALFADGAVIEIDREQIVEQPIRLLHVSTGEAELMTNSRNIIFARSGCRADVIEQYVSLEDAGSDTDAMHFNNVVTQIVAERNSHVDHYFIEQESEQAINFSTLEARQATESKVKSHTALFGGRLVRNNVHPVIEGEHAYCLVNGLYVGHGRQHMDNFMRVEHARPHGDSRQFYRGILMDRAHAVFCGRIVVAKGADKTDAKQSNSNLLLSDHARANTLPQLEIYADDVKCTHGATVGQLDDEAVFYLQARGIDRETARGLLVYSFAAESLDRMGCRSVREAVKGELIRKLSLGSSMADVLDDRATILLQEQQDAETATHPN